MGNACDNCPGLSNGSQADTDGDAIGDLCDSDGDGDSVLNEVDNCPSIPNKVGANGVQAVTVNVEAGGTSGTLVQCECRISSNGSWTPMLPTADHDGRNTHRGFTGVSP